MRLLSTSVLLLLFGCGSNAPPSLMAPEPTAADIERETARLNESPRRQLARATLITAGSSASAGGRLFG
jgi:hypothetical protein